MADRSWETPVSKPLSTAWTQNLQGQAKEDFEIIVRNSTLLLTRLQQIIDEKERSLFASASSVSDFSDPNWSHKQAFRNGELAQLKFFKTLIPF